VNAVLIFAITLLVAVLLSGLARRSVLSTAVLFLASGLIFGGALGWISIRPDELTALRFAELALFSVLFSEGMRVSIGDLSSVWRLPGRALLFGLPLTLVATAALAHWVAGLPWGESLLLGAILSPTDPVLAAAIVGRKDVPGRLRRLLNIESGLNDGIALPIAIALMAWLSAERFDAVTTLGQLALGVAIGIFIPWAIIRLEGSQLFSAEQLYEPLAVFTIGLLILAVASLTHANEFLAAFAAGITVTATSSRLRDEFERFGELLAELFKLSGLLVFGALISPQILREVGWRGYVFAMLAIVAARPFAFSFALLGSKLSWREWVTAAWFGPKGFASVFLALLALQSGIPHADQIFHLAAIVIATSIVLHSSTDILVAKWFKQKAP
jgi:NhaP-type Na+/H+ or K+/H+ antiporter